MAAKWSRKSADHRCERLASGAALRAAVGLLAMFVVSTCAWAQGYDAPANGNGWAPTYQRQGHGGKPWPDGGDWKRDHHRFRPTGPDISAGSVQRPYPYHLDYYKMKYGGSYAPYFGNLYGPPTFVGAPFFGNGTFNPWLGYEGGFNGYPPGGVGYPVGWGPDGYEGPYGNGGPGYPGPVTGGCVGPNCPDANGVVEGSETITEPQ